LAPQDAPEPGWGPAGGERRGARKGTGLPGRGEAGPTRAAEKEGELGRLPGPAGGRVVGWLRERSGNLIPLATAAGRWLEDGLPAAKGPGLSGRRVSCQVRASWRVGEDSVAFGGRKEGEVVTAGEVV
jgi:hypothetical protein